MPTDWGLDGNRAIGMFTDLQIFSSHIGDEVAMNLTVDLYK